jgi:hypothetical protein
MQFSRFYFADLLCSNKGRHAALHVVLFKCAAFVVPSYMYLVISLKIVVRNRVVKRNGSVF